MRRGDFRVGPLRGCVHGTMGVRNRQGIHFVRIVVEGGMLGANVPGLWGTWCWVWVAVVGGFGVCWLRALFFCVFWWVFYFLVFVCDDFG